VYPLQGNHPFYLIVDRQEELGIWPGPDSAARVGVCEAWETGAHVFAVACSNCAKMLEDAVKAEGLQEQPAVMDLAEIVQAP
jgi:hypothetical protein